MKKCGRCNAEKEEIEFHKDKSRKDGLYVNCKKCESKRRLDERLKDPDSYRKRERERARKNSKERYKKYFSNPVNVEKRRKWSRESYNRNKINIRAKQNEKNKTDEAREKSRVRSKRWRYNNIEKSRLYYRLWMKEWRNKNPEKDRAHYMMNGAVRYGRLHRAPNCEVCGIACKTEGHHEDYSKPLEVKWVCKQCHVKITFNRL